MSSGSQESDSERSALGAKVVDLFREFAGERSSRLDPRALAVGGMDAVMQALTPEYGVDRANEIAFHLMDWNWDAAFLVALHLFPERFSDAEIDEGVTSVLSHVPYHVREACRVAGDSIH